MVVDVIDGGGENFVFQIVQDFRRRFGVRAPLDFQDEMMWCDPSAFALVPNALVDQLFHPFDELGGCESATRLDGATETTIDHVAHSFEHATEDAFRQRVCTPLLFAIVALEFACRVEVVSHEQSIRVFRHGVQRATWMNTDRLYSSLNGS